MNKFGNNINCELQNGIYHAMYRYFDFKPNTTINVEYDGNKIKSISIDDKCLTEHKFCRLLKKIDIAKMLEKNLKQHNKSFPACEETAKTIAVIVIKIVVAIMTILIIILWKSMNLNRL